MIKAIIYIIFFALLLVVWELGTMHNSSLRLLISNPSESFAYFGGHSAVILESAMYTAYESVIGLITATLISFVLIYICLVNKAIYKLIMPLMIVSQVIPIVTLAPLFIVLLGIGLKSKIAMATVMCFFPIFVNTGTGVDSIDKNYHYLFDMYDARPFQKIMRMYFPLATPHIFSGLKVSSTLAVVGAIVAEFNGAEIGLGKNLFLAAKRLDAALMINSIFFSCLLGGVLYLIILLIERRIGKWYINNKING